MDYHDHAERLIVMTTATGPGEGSPRTVGDVLAKLPAIDAAAFLALTLTVVGSVGPWATTILGGSVAGTTGDGKLTAGAAVLAALLFGVLRSSRSAVRAGAAMLLALAAAGVSGYDLVHVREAAAKVLLFGHQIAAAGWGIYATLIGALAASAAMFVAYLDAPPRRESSL